MAYRNMAMRIHQDLKLTLCLGALYAERDHISKFFINFGNWKTDLIWGFILAAMWCGTEYFLEGTNSEEARPFFLTSFLMIPIFVLLAGWRAGVYEELLFRSLLMGNLQLWMTPRFAPVLVQAIVFWAAHPRYYLHGLWYQSAANFLFGLLLGIVVCKRNSILPAIIIHSMGNTYGIVGIPLEQAFSKAIRSWFH